MDLLEKEQITEPLIKTNQMFDEHDEYVKGYFTDLKHVSNNEDFLEIYRYIQYWKLPYPDYMTYYASQPNYAPKSLLANMALTGEDSYYSYFKDLIDNSKYTPTELPLFETSENVYENLVKLNRADLVLSENAKGVPFMDIFSGHDYGNSTLEVVRIMLTEDYEPSDEVIVWYVQHGFGRIVNMCIPSSDDPEFIFDEIPRDLDFYDEMLKSKYNDKISEDDAECILNKVLTDPENQNTIIDVAMLLKLYRTCSSKMTTEYKKVLLTIIARKEQPFLTSTFLKELTTEECSCKLTSVIIRDLIVDIIKDKRTYVIFFAEILGWKNYNSIVDFGNDIEPDETVPYEINSDDYADMITEKYYEDSSSESDRDDDDDSDDEYVQDRDRYTYKYDGWCEDDLYDRDEDEDD